MHISEGILSGPVLVTGMAIALVGTAVGLKKLAYDRIARAGILAAAFFVASLVHVPIGPSNAHLIMNGIAGLLLGWGAFPVIMVALLLQGMIFQFGGITTLGINTVILAGPAVICYYAFGTLARRKSATSPYMAFFCGFFSVLLSTMLFAAALIFTEDNFLEIAGIIAIAHVPVMVIEGFVCSFSIAFLKKVQPTLFNGQHENKI